jgi:integrase
MPIARAYRRLWARVCRMGSVVGTTPKSARHSFRSAGPEAGIAAEHMRELMGHATSEMTDQVYWHANKEA